MERETRVARQRSEAITNGIQPLKIKIISCWFATSYGEYTDGLRHALERRLGSEVGVIASNCGCGHPEEVKRRFHDQRCEYFEFPHVRYFKSDNPLKYWLRTQARQLIYLQRAKRYLGFNGDADVVHFQQTLNAYGSVAVFNWLRLPAVAARVVTVHELDPHQTDHPQSNLAYNRADRIIVHAANMKEQLIGLGVDGGRIDVVEHGVEVRPMPDGPRQTIIFYGAHRLHVGKGVDSLFKAMAMVKTRLGEKTPSLVVHGHYGNRTPEYGLQLAAQNGIEDLVQWRNQIDAQATAEAYGKALICVLPYTGSFAGLAAANALANGAAVIATRRAGLPDHLGDAAVWIPENDPGSLADAILRLLSDEASRLEIVQKGRERAESHLSWDRVAAKTILSYQAALDHKRAAQIRRTAG